MRLQSDIFQFDRRKILDMVGRKSKKILTLFFAASLGRTPL